MQTLILVHAILGSANDVARRIAELPDIESAEAVSGPYDVIVRADSASLEIVVHAIVPKIRAIRGVTRTVTCPVIGHRYTWVERIPGSAVSV